MPPRPRDHWSLIALGVMVISVMTAACAGDAATPPAVPTASPAAVATSTPLPTPSPTPVDISAAFLKAITDKDFQAAENVTGTLKIGPTTSSLLGSGAQSGSDSRETLTIRTGSDRQVSSTITIGEKRWSKMDPGPWLETPSSADGHKDFSDFLAGLTALTDLGIEIREGHRYHHLQPSGGNAIGAEYVGFGTGPNVKDPAFTIDFYATDDGTPALVVLAGTWTIAAGDKDVPASIEFENALTEVGTAQTVEPPDDVWVRYTSKKLGYSMAHPAGMKVTSKSGQDSFVRDGQDLIFVATSKYKGSTARFAADLVATYAKPFGGGPDSQTNRTLGGQPAVRLAYKFRDNAGLASIVVDDTTTRGGLGWEVFIVTNGGDADVSLFNQFVATFTFTE